MATSVSTVFVETLAILATLAVHRWRFVAIFGNVGGLGGLGEHGVIFLIYKASNFANGLADLADLANMNAVLADLT